MKDCEQTDSTEKTVMPIFLESERLSWLTNISLTLLPYIFVQMVPSHAPAKLKQIYRSRVMGVAMLIDRNIIQDGNKRQRKFILKHVYKINENFHIRN